jgi:hypothetical protein
MTKESAETSLTVREFVARHSSKRRPVQWDAVDIDRFTDDGRIEG